MFVFPIANSLREGTIYSLVRPKKNANTLDVEKKYFLCLILSIDTITNICALVEKISDRKSLQTMIFSTSSDNVSVLGQDERYTIKYNPLPEGFPKGEA